MFKNKPLPDSFFNFSISKLFFSASLAFATVVATPPDIAAAEAKPAKIGINGIKPPSFLGLCASFSILVFNCSLIFFPIQYLLFS